MIRHPENPVSRRTALSMLGLGAAGLLAACADSSSSSSSTAPTSPSTAPSTSADTSPATTTPATDVATTVPAPTSSVAAVATPAETGGPFPADGSNANGAGKTVNILADPRSLRSDIRSDLDGTNTQDGVPLALTITVDSLKTGAPLTNAAVYIWHCSKTGVYSEYNSPLLGGDFTARSFLRGAQVTDAQGRVTFRTILPGRYQGRAFHIHFEVYGDNAYSSKVLTSQIAVDDALIDQLYAAAGYDQALKNKTTNAQDSVFSDGVDHELMTVTGDVANGLTATFTAVV